uniref:Neuromedin-U isoform X2 n=1 Tax=Geotrypetes seraphini TaxID=260995 RepID=A0A6P8RGE4_GEOSA|nr:neuromedin-U isoform X2 [Geotrypetes seraphini]
MPTPDACQRAAPPSPSATGHRNRSVLRKLPQGSVLGSLMLLLLLASCMCACKGAPLSLQTLQDEHDMQLWNEIDNTCSAFMSTDPRSQASSALEELCYMVMGILQKSQLKRQERDHRRQMQIGMEGLDEKDNAKRFLFHYAKTHDSGNSDIMSSVLHPLLQLVPQLHERRMKRFKTDEELEGPGGIQSRGYFLFRVFDSFA